MTDCKRMRILGTIDLDHPTATLDTFNGTGHLLRRTHHRYWVCEDEKVLVIPLRARETGGTEIRIPLEQLRKVISND